MYDVLIVGQGLAGSLLAWHLLQRGVHVAVVSDGKTAASHIAAGIINPVTGQRFVLAADTEKQLAIAQACYQHIEQQLHCHFYHPKPMLRLFNNEKEQRACQKRFSQAAYAPYLSPSPAPQHLHQPYGSITQHHTAYVDTNALLSALQHHFTQLGIVQPQAEHHVSANNHCAKITIFCEGYRMLSNPLFAWLPLQPVHGEIISCTTNQALPSSIINQSKWLLPTTHHTCKIGATYDPNISTPTLQPTSKALLLDFAQRLFKTDKGFHISNHQAGIRPATQDKHPFIGFHPTQPNMAIFNGFGSRGSLLIPYYAQLFSQHLDNPQALPSHVNINRYHPLIC